jgi:general secretion pathway protein G
MDNPEYFKKMLPLLAVMIGIIALGVGISVISPRSARHQRQSPEAELRQDLAQLRGALAKYHSDVGKYPDSLDDLVKQNYLGQIPADPLTRSSTTWVLLAPGSGEDGVADIRSGAPGNAPDGTAYGEW